MSKSIRQLLFWTPRIAGILFILFISLFALDVFGAGYGFWETLLALCMHLLPSLALTAGLVLAWRWEWVGAVLFGGFAGWYLAVMRGFDWTVYLLLAGIPLVVGALFALGWIYRREIRRAA
jgi:hypothetical protein